MLMPPRSMSTRRLFKPFSRFCPQNLRIGEREIRRRQRVDVLPREEVDLPPDVLGQALDRRHRLVQMARGDQIRLLEVVEQE
jgi:hypothetical protein